MTQPRLQSVEDGTSWDGPTPPSGESTSPKLQKQRAERSLPTDRLSLDKQADSLLQVAKISGNSRRAVTAEDQSNALGLKGNTGGLSNKFFRDSGWVDSSGRGNYVATDALLEYDRYLAVDADNQQQARAVLAATARQSWYWQEIHEMLVGGVRQSVVVHALMKAAGAGTGHMPQILILIEWLIWLGLAVRDGDQLRAVPGPAHEQAVADQQRDEPIDAVLIEQPSPEVMEADTLPLSPAPPSAQPAVDGAVLSFNLSVRITADDLGKLDEGQLQQLLSFAERMRG